MGKGEGRTVEGIKGERSTECGDKDWNENVTEEWM